MKKQETYQWSKKNHSIFESFAIDLQEFWKGGKKPEFGSRMMKQSLEKQRAYLEKNDLRMEYEMMPNGHLAEKPVTIDWKDEIYKSQVECRTCALQKKILKGDKVVYKHKENVSLYMTTTKLLKGDIGTLQSEIVNCPNCGAPNTIAQLEEGCPHCQTCFKMSELFPKVTNYYTVRSVGGTEKEMRSYMKKFCIPCMIICIIALCLYYNYAKVDTANVLLNCLGGVIIGAIAGFVLGYFLCAMSLLFSGLWQAGQAMPLLMAMLGSKNRFVNTVKKYSPEFSYEYFSNKVVTILRLFLSEEKIEDHPYYVGEPVDIDAAKIIEYDFRGVVGIKRCQMQGARCSVVADVYMSDYYYNGSSVHRKNNVFRLTLQKDLSKQMNYHFTLSAIRCKNCGASFDAYDVKECPYCNTKYEIGDDDWVVTKLQKLK